MFNKFIEESYRVLQKTSYPIKEVNLKDDKEPLMFFLNNLKKIQNCLAQGNLHKRFYPNTASNPDDIFTSLDLELSTAVKQAVIDYCQPKHIDLSPALVKYLKFLETAPIKQIEDFPNGSLMKLNQDRVLFGSIDKHWIYLKLKKNKHDFQQNHQLPSSINQFNTDPSDSLTQLPFNSDEPSISNTPLLFFRNIFLPYDSCWNRKFTEEFDQTTLPYPMNHKNIKQFDCFQSPKTSPQCTDPVRLIIMQEQLQRMVKQATDGKRDVSDIHKESKLPISAQGGIHLSKNHTQTVQNNEINSISNQQQVQEQQQNQQQIKRTWVSSSQQNFKKSQNIFQKSDKIGISNSFQPSSQQSTGLFISQNVNSHDLIVQKLPRQKLFEQPRSSTGLAIHRSQDEKLQQRQALLTSKDQTNLYFQKSNKFGNITANNSSFGKHARPPRHTRGSSAEFGISKNIDSLRLNTNEMNNPNNESIKRACIFSKVSSMKSNTRNNNNNNNNNNSLVGDAESISNRRIATAAATLNSNTNGQENDENNSGIISQLFDQKPSGFTKNRDIFKEDKNHFNSSHKVIFTGGTNSSSQLQHLQSKLIFNVNNNQLSKMNNDFNNHSFSINKLDNSNTNSGMVL